MISSLQSLQSARLKANGLVLFASSTLLSPEQQEAVASATVALIDQYRKDVLAPKLTYELSDIEFRQQSADYFEGLTEFFKAAKSQA